jgi:5'-AMP-activated protein kinase catalytic alpha subunit
MNLEKNEEPKTINNKKKPNKGPYLLGEALGEGAFAKVRLATQIHIKEKCAIKIVNKSLLEGTKDIQRLKKEIKILKSIRHKNIIQLFDIMESKTNLYFVMEYCKGGELFDYIVKNKRLKENEACVFFQQIINGVEYLHNQGIIHRDLKPENLLLDYKNNIKISDFGLSTFYSKNNFLQTACGTPFYAPPEMLEGLQYNGEASDIWSCGIILYAMLCGSLPFPESKEEIIVKKIKSHDYVIPNYLSKEAQDMLYHILKINPEERFTIDKIKLHPWFNLSKPHLMKGISLTTIKIPVDDNILNMVQEYGFDKEECRRLLLNNKFCSLTSIYYLILKKYVREGGKSISDLESDLFEEYINDNNNYIKDETNTENKENKNSNNRQNKEEIKSEKDLKVKIKDININNENLKFSNSPDEKNKNIKGIFISKKENINKNKEKNTSEIKTILIKNNQPTSQKKQQNNKNPKKNINQNIQQNKKNIKNNLIIQDKDSKQEEIFPNNNNNTQFEHKPKNNDPKLNSPFANKSKNFINHQNNLNTIIMKKKTINKKQNNPQNQLNTEIMKSPERYAMNKMNGNTLINSFIGKNKSLEKDISNNKIEKIKSNKNIKNNKSNNIDALENSRKLKKIAHSNTITNNTIINVNMNNNNKIQSSKKNIVSNIGISPTKENKNFINTKYINDPNDLLFPVEKNDLDINFDENKFNDEQKPLNIINYIAKKLVSSSFCGSFNLLYSSSKKNNSGRMQSANIHNHNHFISNGNLYYNKESNPIKEEIEYIKENNSSSENIKQNYNNENIDKNNNNNNSGSYNDNFYFKNLISILNQKFKKYAQNYELSEINNSNNEIKLQKINHKKDESNKNIPKTQNQNIITISNQKTKNNDSKILFDKKLNSKKIHISLH